MRSWFVPVLQFWFGDVDSLGRSDVAHARRWFMKDAAFDREIADRFGDVYADVRAGLREAWLDDPRGRVAYVIVLDQFPRNMFRGTARAFATDAKALKIAEAAVAQGFDCELAKDGRMFLYLPFEHAESGPAQVRSVALTAGLGDPALTKWAEAHKAIVDRFGRFPHRNAALGRFSTPEEIEFLKQPGSSF